jgi:hypothetical protein
LKIPGFHDAARPAYLRESHRHYGGYGFFCRVELSHAATNLILVRSVAANNGVGFDAGDTNTTLRFDVIDGDRE